MNTDEFLTRVRDRAGLIDYQDAQRACEVVFQTLNALLAHSSRDKIVDELPDELKKSWESSMIGHLTRSVKGVEDINMLEFLDRVRNEARLQTRDQAVIVTQAVFATLNEHLSHSVKRDMVRELPNDIHEFWKSSFKVVLSPGQESRALPEEVEARESSVTESSADLPGGQYGSGKIGPSAAEIYRSDQQIESEVKDLLDASDEIDASEINVTVQQGRVTLKGIVKNSAEKNAAERIASDALGVTEIKNKLHAG